MNKWAHLPNAKRIDWVLASLKDYTKEWDVAWSAVRGAVCYVTRDEVWKAIKNKTRNAAWSVARSASLDAILTLVAYDDCGYMLESDVGELKILAAFGDTKAILLLSACIVFNETKSLQLA